MSPFTADEKADLIETRSIQLASRLEKRHPKKMQHLDNLLNKIGCEHYVNRVEEPTPPQRRRLSKSSGCSSQCSTRCSSIDGNPQFAQDVHLEADFHPHQTHFPKDTQTEEYGLPHLVTLPNLKADGSGERRRCVYSPLNTKAKPAWSDDFQFLGGHKNQSQRSLQRKDFVKLPIMVGNCKEQRCHKSQYYSARAPTCLHDEDTKLKTLLPRRTSPDKFAGMANLPRKMRGDAVQDLAMDASQRITTLSEDATQEHMRPPRALSARTHHQQTTEHMRSPRAISARAHHRTPSEYDRTPSEHHEKHQKTIEQIRSNTIRIRSIIAISARAHHQKTTKITGDQPIPIPPQSRRSNATRPRRSNVCSLNQSEMGEGPKSSEDKSEEVQKPIPSPPQRSSSNAIRSRKPSVCSRMRQSLRCARAKLQQAMPEKETLDMLMKTRHQRLVKEARLSNGFVLLKNRLGKEDRERIKQAFSCYDVDGSGSLDTSELQGALADLGYCPRSREEKLQFSKILEDVDRDGNGELNMQEFEQAVVRVMDMLRNLQSTELFESFHLHDVDGTGSLSVDEVFDILPELGLAPRIDEEHEMVRECVTQVDVDNSNEIDFNEFEELLVQVRKCLHRMRRERRRNIIQQCELERGIVEAFKNEICELKDQFDCYDRDHSGFLDRSELDLLIADCGLEPRSKAEREEVQALIACSDKDHNGHVTFVEFLHLVHGIRQLSSERRQEELHKLFKRWDKDGNGSMSLRECSSLLEHVGLCPKTQQEQCHIGLLLEAMDEDGNGELDFEEFTHFCQRVKEVLQLKVHQKELEAAKSLQITIAQLQEYKLVFEHLDANATGQLSVKRVREMVDSLRINISGDELHEIFTQVDENHSGFIEFSEFLKLVSLVYKHAARSNMRFST